MQELRPLLAQLRPRSVIIYEEPAPRYDRKTSEHFLDIIGTPEFCPPNPLRSSESPENKKKVSGYTGDFTPYSRRNFTRAVDNLWAMAKPRSIFNPITEQFQYFRISAITLTLPPLPADFTNKQVTAGPLHDFLTLLRNRYGLNLYVWKAELQKNFTIHYHILSDLFILKNILTNIWNRILAKYGILQEFQIKYDHLNAPSTRIETVKDWSYISEYLKKYSVKKVTEAEIQSLPLDFQNKIKIAKVYDCSVILQKTKYPTFYIGNELDDFLRYQEAKGILTKNEESFYTGYFLKPGKRKIEYPRNITLEIKSYYSEILKTA